MPRNNPRETVVIKFDITDLAAIIKFVRVETESWPDRMRENLLMDLLALFDGDQSAVYFQRDRSPGGACESMIATPEVFAVLRRHGLSLDMHPA